MDALSQDRLDTLRFGVNFKKLKIILAAIMALGDGLSLAASVGIAETIAASSITSPPINSALPFSSIVFIASMLALITFFGFLGHYVESRPIWKEIRQILNVLGVTACLAGTLLFITDSALDRYYFSSFWISCLVLLPAQRFAVKRALIAFKYNVNGTVILGTGKNALGVAEAMLKDPLMRHELVGFIALPNVESGQTCVSVGGRDYPIAHIDHYATRLLGALRAPKIIVALDDGELDGYENLTSNLEGMFLTIEFVSAFRGFATRGISVHKHFGQDLLFLQLRARCDTGICKALKRALDITAASLILTLISPLFAFLLWKTMKSCGSPIFGHERVGQNGKSFKCYKFRTMIKDADTVLQDLINKNPAAREEWEKTFKLKDDPRVTPFGKFLRSSSLDELPQLWNVLKGDMSLVGPRPIVRKELDRYGGNAKYYLQVKPGLTGLWQISGRSNTTYDNRVYLDTWYVKNWCLKSDIVILFKTVPAVLKGAGAY